MSKQIVLVGDSISGTTTSDHHVTYDSEGHPIYSSCAIIGVISSGSSHVFIKGKRVAVAGDSTLESDCEDSGQSGKLIDNGCKIKIKGKSIALMGDAIAPHNGTAHISSASSGIFINV